MRIPKQASIMTIIAKGKTINEVVNIERKYAVLDEFNHAEGKNINNAINNNILVEYFLYNIPITKGICNKIPIPNTTHPLLSAK